MALYHFSVKAISRADGRSVVACAAYRSGEKLTCEYYGKEQDYTRKTGVEFTNIYAPENTKSVLLDRNQLWNSVEKVERKKNALLAREFEIAFPSELNAQQRKKMLDELCQNLVKKHGVIVDAAIHAPHKDGGSDERNYHAHIMFTTRAIDPHTGEFSAKKYRDFSRDSGTKTVCHWRESFADLTNRHLEKAGYDVRVDHRSYRDQGIELEATVHEGPKATQLRRMGVETEIVLRNELIKQRNAERIEAPRLLKGLEQEIFASEKIVSTLKNERDELNIKMNKINLVEAQERVQSFKKIFDAFHNAIDNDGSILENVKTVREYDFHRKSQQYIADLDFLTEQGITPKAKGILGTLRVSQLIKKDRVLNDLSVMSDLSKQYSKEKAEYKAKIESDRRAQAKALQEEADRSAKSQKEISDFQKNVGELSRKAGYPNDFFSEKFRFFSFYRNTYDIFSEIGAVQKDDKQAYSKLVIERYEKIRDDFTEERAHTHRGRCPGKDAFQDLYKLIQADKKIAQSFDMNVFERIIKIEKSVKNYENFLYNQEHSASPKSTLEHSPVLAKKIDHDNQFRP
jgi:hypothetical protein